MNSGQVEARLAHDNLRDQVVLEWVKVFGILLGAGLAPLLLGMAKIDPFWLFGLLTGLLTIITGVIYGLRQAAATRRRLAEANPPRVLEEGKLPPRDIHIHMQPPDKQLPAIGGPAQDQAGEATYTYLHTTPMFMIALGIFILLPALVGFLAQQGRLEAPTLIQWYFSSPAIFLWLAEPVYFYRRWQAVSKKNLHPVGLLKSGLQMVGALVLWSYLGSFFGSKGTNGIVWLFWPAAGLAAAGALLGSLAGWLQQRSTGRQNKVADLSPMGAPGRQVTGEGNPEGEIQNPQELAPKADIENPT